MGVTVEGIGAACAGLRRAQGTLLAPIPQRDVVAAVSEWATRWKDPRSGWRQTAESLTTPFPFAMTRISLDALLDSLVPETLWALIDSERLRNAQGVALVGHVIAGNTPLLAWVSGLRALLMRSASFVKLPSGSAASWGRLFYQSLAEVAPSLAPCIHLAEWPGGTSELDAALCHDVDLLLAYGSQSTLRDLRGLCPPDTGFLGYGHRVSFGLIPGGADFGSAARGLAHDVVLFDQGGCLSPQTIFVEGDWADVHRFAECLADAFRSALGSDADLPPTPPAAARVQEARLLARMTRETALWEDRHLRWTVIARNETAFAFSPTHGVVSVQPLAGPQGLKDALAPCAGHLQGCAVAPIAEEKRHDVWSMALQSLGVSWICRPGALQTPPFSWREDGKDVLRCLLPASLR